MNRQNEGTLWGFAGFLFQRDTQFVLFGSNMTMIFQRSLLGMPRYLRQIFVPPYAEHTVWAAFDIFPINFALKLPKTPRETNEIRCQ